MSLEELWQLFPIELKPHNPAYSEWYSEEEAKLKELFSKEDIKRISHMGSSAVPGLVAKPIVDILLEVDKKTDIKELKITLNESGWCFMGGTEKEGYLRLSFNKGYTIDGFAKKVYHLHVMYHGDWNELYFRDYLKEHKSVAKEYEELKINLLEEFRNNRDGYTEAKTDFINRYTKLAREQYQKRYEVGE